MKISLMMLIGLMFTGCSNDIIIHNIQQPEKRIIKESFPFWVYQIPENENTVVGISHLTFDEKKYIEAAKQMAAVMMSRNESSFVVDKYAETNSENIIKTGKAEFKLNVSSDPQKTEELFSKLKLITSYKYNGYFIGLFSLKNLKLPEKYKKESISKI